MNMYFERDEKGNLIPIKRRIETGEEITITPITRGEWKRIIADASIEDKELHIVVTHCVIPKIEESKKDIMMDCYVSAILKEIFDVSGFKFNKKQESDELKDFLKQPTQ